MRFTTKKLLSRPWEFNIAHLSSPRMEVPLGLTKWPLLHENIQKETDTETGKTIHCDFTRFGDYSKGTFTNYVCIFWHLTTCVPPHSLHFLFSKFSIFLTAYPRLNANVICEGSLNTLTVYSIEPT